MTTGGSRRAIFRALFWAQMTPMVLMAAVGTIYEFCLFLGLTLVSNLVYPVALQLVLVFRVLVYVSIGLVIAFGFYQRIIRLKKPIDQSLKDRLRLLVAQTQQRMMVNKSTRLFILPRSSNAANAGRNRIIVGEKLVQQMDDQELVGIIGHELAHGLQHHVFIKAMLFPIIAFLGISLYLVAGSGPNEAILVWTIFSGILLSEIPLSWRLEYSADHRSAELLGKKSMIRGLEHLRKTHYDGISFTHPPLSRRIDRLARDETLQETVVEAPIVTNLSSVSIVGDAPLIPLRIEKSKPAESPTQVWEASKPAVCPICGVQIPIGKTKCWACGTTLRP